MQVMQPSINLYEGIGENIVQTPEGNTLLKTLTKMCEIYFHVPKKKKELITLGAQHSNLTFTVLHNQL